MTAVCPSDDRRRVFHRQSRSAFAWAPSADGAALGVSGRTRDWVKFKNRRRRAVKRETEEEDWNQ